MNVSLLLPLLAFAAGLGAHLALNSETDWRLSCTRTVLLVGSMLLLTTEILSLFSAISRLSLTMVWSLTFTGAVVVLLRTGGLGGRLNFRRLLGHWSGAGWFLAGTGVVLGLTAIVAWLAPPQTWDSLNYHLSRVAHWDQLGAVRHYPTGIEVQNSMPPLAEMAVLHTYVLSGSDRWVNFVQWGSMLVSLIGLTLIAARLGGSRRGQAFGALIAASIPMGIIQASATMTDYVVTLWMVAIAVEVLQLLDESGEHDRDAVMYLTLGAGLALATKPTAAAYLLPFGLLAGVALYRRLGTSRDMATAVLVAVVGVAGLNAGWTLRNLGEYGHPLGSPHRVSVHSNGILGPRGLMSNLLRNAALHAGTPSDHVNKAVALSVQWAHQWMGLDHNDPRTTSAGVFRVRRPTTHEDWTGNPLHAALIGGVLIVGLVKRRQLGQRHVAYGITVIGTFVAFSWLFKWQIFGSRYHLPFFVLAAPLLAVLLIRWLPPRWVSWVAMVFLVGAWPWLFHIQSRPLIRLPGASKVGSILVEPRSRLYFANGLYLYEPYNAAARRIQSAGCDEVGISLPGNSAEYLLWVALDARDQGKMLRWIVEGGAQGSRSFTPCAVICQSCPPGTGSFRGLPLMYGTPTSYLRLYLASPESERSDPAGAQLPYVESRDPER